MTGSAWHPAIENACLDLFQRDAIGQQFRWRHQSGEGTAAAI
jgi:hypothetical protein